MKGDRIVPEEGPTIKHFSSVGVHPLLAFFGQVDVSLALALFCYGGNKHLDLKGENNNNIL